MADDDNTRDARWDIRRIGDRSPVFAVLRGERLISMFQDEAAAKCARIRWEAGAATGIEPEWTLSLAQACLNAITIEKAAAAEKRLAVLEAQLVRREHAAKGGKTRQETREEDDEPEWMSRAVDIAAKARAADPTIHGTTIINEQILPRCEGMVGLPKFDMLMKHMARWEATGLVPRKTKAKLLSAVPRGKRKILRPL